MVNSVSFGKRMEVFEKPNLDAPQTNVRPAVNQPTVAPKNKNHSTLKTVAGVAAAAVAVAGLLVAGNKYGAFKPETIKKFIPDKVLNFDKLNFLKSPIKTALGGLDKAGEWIANNCVKAFNAVKGVFTKKPAETGEITGLLR